jgi:hypothetical protein
VKDRRARANENGGDQENREARREGEDQEAEQGRTHAEGQRIGHGVRVGVAADQRLHQRRRSLIDQRNEADLREG